MICTCLTWNWEGLVVLSGTDGLGCHFPIYPFWTSYFGIPLNNFHILIYRIWIFLLDGGYDFTQSDFTDSEKQKGKKQPGMLNYVHSFEAWQNQSLFWLWNQYWHWPWMKGGLLDCYTHSYVVFVDPIVSRLTSCVCLRYQCQRVLFKPNEWNKRVKNETR